MRIFLLLILLNIPGVMAEGNDRILHLYGRGFSFRVAEPLGWKLDTRSAPQIANFIFHPAGQNWRNSKVLIFARFVPKQSDMNLEEFMDQNQKRFEEECPFADSNVPEPELDSAGAFVTRTFNCPGFRSEVIAVHEVSRFFVLFALSSSDPAVLNEGLPALERIVQSFQWFDEPPRKEGDPNP